MFHMLRAHREVCRQHEMLSEPVWGVPFVGTTQDEKHPFTSSRSAEVCELCNRYKDLIANMFQMLHVFTQTS